MTIQELVNNYIKTRDRKDALTKLYKEKAAKYEHALDLIEAMLLKTLDENGLESVRTENGTVFTSSRTSATVADREVFLEFVRQNEAWVFLENRVSKNAVEQHIAAYDVPPPGVSLRIERTVNIRRPSK